MKLRLDFAHPRHGPAPLGWLLLVAGLVAAGWAGWRYQTVSMSTQIEQAKLAGLTPKHVRKLAVKPVARPAPLQEVSGLTATRNLIDADWGGLLTALETTRPPTIALLAVEAEAARNSISITAEAKDHRAMLAYVNSLEDLPILDRVALANHADQEREGEKAVRFNLRAHWTMRGSTQ